MAAERSTIRRVARGIAVAGLSSLAALAYAELVLRWRGSHQPASAQGLFVQGPDSAWVPASPELDPYVRYDADGTSRGELRYEFQSDLALRYEYGSEGARPYMDARGGVVARTNAHGRRGPDVPRKKSERTWRIAVVGDSITFGHGVREEDTYARRLERHLGQRLAGAGWRCEVVNGGVSGYGASDCAAYLRHRLLEYEPDVVVYGFLLNDVLTGASLLELQEFREAARAYVGRHQPGEAPHALHLVRLLRAVQYRREYESLVCSLYRSALQPEARPWQDCREEILAMRRESEARGARFVLAVLPMLFEASGGFCALDSAHAMIRQWCEGERIALLDALDVLCPYSAEELAVHVTDYHYNELAHELVAGALASFLAAHAMPALEDR